MNKIQMDTLKWFSSKPHHSLLAAYSLRYPPKMFALINKRLGLWLQFVWDGMADTENVLIIFVLLTQLSQSARWARLHIQISLLIYQKLEGRDQRAEGTLI